MKPKLPPIGSVVRAKWDSRTYIVDGHHGGRVLLHPFVDGKAQRIGTAIMASASRVDIVKERAS